MAAKLLRGAPVAARIRTSVEASAALLRSRTGVDACLATVAIGQDPAALAYRDSIERSIGRACVTHRAVELPSQVGPSEMVDLLHGLNEDRSVHGVLLLMPLPPQIPVELAIEHLSPMKDVDGITPLNAGRLHLGIPALRPSTPQGGIELLDFYGFDPAGMRTVVVGRSNVVGKPLAALLTARDATVTICHRKTRNLDQYLREAQLVALAAGSPGTLHRDNVRPGAVVLDFGINVVGETIVGDARASEVVEQAAAYTPVPGGTGPVTTMVLARNTVAAAFASLGIEVEAPSARAAAAEASTFPSMTGGDRS